MEGAALPYPPAAAAPAAHGLQHVALRPPRPEVTLGMPELNSCVLSRELIADRPRGRREQCEFISANESGLVCMFVRRLKTAIYGEVWDALAVERVGEGSADEHFRVRHDERGMQRRLAVKRMRWDDINRLRDTHQEDPLREIAALSRMRDPEHPNVLSMVEALSDGTTVYLVTPFVDGGELFDWVAEEGVVGEAIVQRMFRQIVDGMRYMHSKGICHADMSLENTLVDEAKLNAFIIDFGMCLGMPTDDRGLRHMSVSDRRRAKPSYCSPEAFKAKAYDGVKVDVFAAGAMLFMMLTGFPPFTVASRTDSSFRQLVWKGDVQGLLRRFQQPPLPTEVAGLLKQMLAYKAEDRPLPAQVLAHAWLAPRSPPPVPAGSASGSGSGSASGSSYTPTSFSCSPAASLATGSGPSPS